MGQANVYMSICKKKKKNYYEPSHNSPSFNIKIFTKQFSFPLKPNQTNYSEQLEDLSPPALDSMNGFHTYRGRKKKEQRYRETETEEDILILLFHAWYTTIILGCMVGEVGTGISLQENLAHIMS